MSLSVAPEEPDVLDVSPNGYGTTEVGMSLQAVAEAENFPELKGVREGLLRQRLAELNDKGESITIMAVGDNGLGKTTLLSNLFAKRVTETNESTIPPTTLEIKPTVQKMQIDGFPFTVKLIDTPGYGDHMSIERYFESIVNYVDKQMQKIYEAEHSTSRKASQHWFEEGIDVLLYFIAPHRLKQIDIELMRRLHQKVTLIPILAKADCMTNRELVEFKHTLMDRLDRERIEIFHPPFAVIAYESVKTDDDGNLVVGRKYEWGFAESENENYSDLPELRRCLVYEGLSDLHEQKQRLYEHHRKMRIRFSTPGPLKKSWRFITRTALHLVLAAVLLPHAKDGLLRLKEEVVHRLPEKKEDVVVIEEPQRKKGWFR
mmetsp:Transcript_9778/g.29728  ORF Transcript_9778/g.29728 Transcript_9778/m.29728 type:complete len:374 (-) Transcript_9778:89-1210(-)